MNFQDVINSNGLWIDAANNIKYSTETNKEIEEIKKELEKSKAKITKLKNERARDLKKYKTEKENEEFFYRIQRMMAERQNTLSPFRPLNVMKSISRDNLEVMKDNIKKVYESCKNEWSEISITYQPMYRVNFDNDTISYITWSVIKEYFKDIQIVLIPEYGDSFHLHYHGFIKGKKSILSKLKSDLLNKFGRSTLKQIKYRDSYLNYILKEQDDEDNTGLIISNII